MYHAYGFSLNIYDMSAFVRDAEARKNVLTTDIGPYVKSTLLLLLLLHLIPQTSLSVTFIDILRIRVFQD